MDPERVDVLFIEDSHQDVDLALRALKQDGLQPLWRRVASAAALKKALADGLPDVILSDFSMPGFDGLHALEIARALAPDVPFIFLSGTIGEERAVEAIRLGARDYVLKDRMRRLGSAVRRALGDAADRARIRAAEEQLRESEFRIRRLNRVYAVLSGINAAIVRTQDRKQLYREACRIAVEAGGFRMAWVGIVDREAMAMKPVAWQGVAPEYLRQIPLSLQENAAEQRSLVRLAYVERKAMVSHDMSTDPRVLLNREALQHGFRSLAVLPLMVGGEVAGVLALYAAETGFFDEGEMKLLLELAGDVSFALGNIENQEKLNYVALYDSLTGLGNRTLFRERLGQYLSLAAQSGEKLALVIADVERLRMVNDSLGRQAGDALLRQLAQRLRQGGDPAQFARIGADNFAVVLQAVKGRTEITRRVEKLWRDWLGEPFRIETSDLKVSARAGIAVFPHDGTDADALLKNAETALRKAKQPGEQRAFYTAELTERSVERMTLENRLRQAVEKEEFVLYYQPKVALETGRIVGAEALVRWNSPEHGLVAPGHFIPLLEETGLILQVGAWALARAVRDHGELLTQGVAAPRIAVNVSAIQLRQRDLVQMVKQAVAGGADPTAIDVEITESLLMEDVAGNIKKLAALRDLGMKIFIDDFGTGYSSLGYLAKLPVHTLKIDRSFIIAMLDDPDTMTLVSTIISLAHSLKMDIVAEGVEQEEQAKVLRLLRCNQMQGYLFSKPVPMEELIPLLRGTK